MVRVLSVLDSCFQGLHDLGYIPTQKTPIRPSLLRVFSDSLKAFHRNVTFNLIGQLILPEGIPLCGQTLLNVPYFYQRMIA